MESRKSNSNMNHYLWVFVCLYLIGELELGMGSLGRSGRRRREGEKGNGEESWFYGTGTKY